jgi:hypothetical protein
MDNNNFFTVQSGELPPVKANSTNGRGIPALVKSLNVGDWFEVPRLKDAKTGQFNRDNSKWAGIIRAAKKLGYEVTRPIKDNGLDDTDLCVRVK